MGAPLKNSVRQFDPLADYQLFAEHCLKMVALTDDRENRLILREMAAEWLRMAEAAEAAYGATEAKQQSA